MVAISRPGSPTMTQSVRLQCRQCVARTVLPSASCGCMRSRASQLPTSSQRYGACTTSTSRGLLHDGVVDADLLHAPHTRGAAPPRAAACPRRRRCAATAACSCGLVARAGVEDRARPSRRRCRCSSSTRREATNCSARSAAGFSRKPLHAIDADALALGDLGAAVDVAVAGGGKRRRDAEGDQRRGVLLGHLRGDLDGPAEFLGRLDDVVGRRDEHDASGSCGRSGPRPGRCRRPCRGRTVRRRCGRRQLRQLPRGLVAVAARR